MHGTGDQGGGGRREDRGVGSRIVGGAVRLWKVIAFIFFLTFS